MEPAASLPHTSHPGARLRAKSSILGDIAHQPDDAAAGFLRFLAVFLDVGHNHLMYPGIGTFRVPSGGKQTDLGVCPRPVTHAGEQGGRIPVLLHPNESDGFIGKSPGIQHRPRLFQQGKRHPKEQGTVLCWPIDEPAAPLYPPKTCRIMAFRRPSRTLLLHTR